MMRWLIGLTALITSLAAASVQPDLKKNFTFKLSQMQKAIARSRVRSRENQKLKLELDNMKLNVTGGVTVGVPSVLSIEIAPSIDFVLVRSGTSNTGDDSSSRVGSPSSSRSSFGGR